MNDNIFNSNKIVINQIYFSLYIKYVKFTYLIVIGGIEMILFLIFVFLVIFCFCACIVAHDADAHIDNIFNNRKDKHI